MKKDLIIVGAGSVGGFIAYNFEPLSDSYNLLGFLDDDITKIGKELFGKPVLGNVERIIEYPDAVVIVGIAFPRIKRLIVNKLNSIRNIEYISYISPDAWISKEVEVGNGVIIYPGSTINYETIIGNFATINMNSSVGHNVIISDYSTLSPSVSLAGFTHLESGVDMGISSCTRQRVRVGENSIVGGNSMLIADVPTNVVVVGSPAKVIKQI